MALTDAPVVKIGSTTLAASWSTTRRVALAGLAITWGRRSHLDRAKPAQLKIEVLDTDGHLTSAQHLTGQPITITRGDDRVIYRGRIDDYDVDHVHVIDPANNVRRRVWKLTLTAGCKLAELAQAVLPGPGDNPAAVKDYGPDYWPFDRPDGRVAALMAAGADEIVDSIAWDAPYATTAKQPYASFHPFGQGKSALDLIELLYQSAPLGHVLYRPYNNSIVRGAPTTTSGLALKYTGGQLRIDFIDGIAGRCVPARTVAVPDGFTARTGVADAIDVVQVSSATELGPTEYFTVEHPTSRKSSATGRREHRVENDIFMLVETAANVGDFAWPFPLSTVSAEFGPRPGIGDGFHDGIDFSGGAASLGADIPAAGPGTYVGKRSHPDWGYNVIIDHGVDVNGDRLRTVYCHLQADPGWPVGKTFAKGQTVGKLGNTGLSTGAHLHYETQVNGVSIDPRSFMKNKQYGDQPTDTLVDDWQQWLASDTADMLDQLNGKLNLPTVRFDFRRFDYHENVTDAVIETYTRGSRALYFPGSVFNVAMDAAAAHQIIGGTLVYHKGWSHDVTLAPAISTAGPGLTINQLCQSTAPTLADFDPDITIADLGNVSQGVPA